MAHILGLAKEGGICSVKPLGPRAEPRSGTDSCKGLGPMVHYWQRNGAY